MRGIVMAALAALLGAAPGGAAELTGVNLAGAEFGGLNGRHGYEYLYPGTAEMRAFAALGATVFRLPVRWERLQPVLGGTLNAAEMTRLDGAVAAATGLGVTVVVDIHNYAKYRRVVIGQPGTPEAEFHDLWTRLANRYKANPKVVFGLMNEPVGIGAEAWAGIAQRTVEAVRRTGARNLVLVPGVNWTGAHSWRKRVGTLSNAEALAGFRDPANNFAFEFHQFVDGNSSGTGTACVPIEEAERRLEVATGWLRETGHRGFLGEFGVADSPHCLNVLRQMLRYLRQNPEWHGWTLWASAAWFGTYPFNLYPLGDGPRPAQLDVVEPFLAGRP